jgi:hypothetical protein
MKCITCRGLMRKDSAGFHPGGFLQDFKRLRDFKRLCVRGWRGPCRGGEGETLHVAPRLRNHSPKPGPVEPYVPTTGCSVLVLCCLLDLVLIVSQVDSRGCSV